MNFELREKNMVLNNIVTQLRLKADEIERLLKDADNMSAEKAGRKYVEDNGLNYCSDEALAAFKAGFICCLRQKETKKLEAKNE